MRSLVHSEVEYFYITSRAEVKGLIQTKSYRFEFLQLIQENIILSEKYGSARSADLRCLRTQKRHFWNTHIERFPIDHVFSTHRFGHVFGPLRKRPEIKNVTNALFIHICKKTFFSINPIRLYNACVEFRARSSQYLPPPFILR